MGHLSLRQVSKTFASGVQALSPTSLELSDGQLMVLVGPSGCGKSTLLRLIAGLEAPSSGSIELDQSQITDVSPKDRDIAMVFQSYALYPHMTVRENLEFGLRMRRQPLEVREREVTTVGDMLGLNSLMSRKPGQLSGGQQQRVALGRAIVRRPKLFLFDEPFSNLDATLRATTRSELLRLHRRLRATSIFVTHDQVEAMTMADVLVVMKDGHVQQSGAPLDVYRRPANMFVAQFIGFPPMNLIRPDLLPNRILSPGGNDGSVLLGLRAEDVAVIHNKNPAGRETWTTTGKVILTEPLGNEVLVTCLAGNQDIVTRIPSSMNLKPGQEVSLALDLAAAVWFDSSSGNLIEAAPVLR